MSFKEFRCCACVRKVISITALVSFISLNLSPTIVNAQSIVLPSSHILSLTPAYAPLLVKGLMVHLDNPFQFDFIVDTGNSNLTGQALNDESMKMIKYFLAALTVPEKQMWVNLSPLENDRIVSENFGQTDMGRDLLAQDYILTRILQ